MFEKTRESLRQHKALMGLGILLGASLCVITFAVITLISLDRSTHEREAAQHIQTNLEAVIDGLTDAETSQRGYIITLDNEYLVTYNKGKRLATDAVKTLRDSSTFQVDASDLALLTETKIEQLDKGLDAQRVGGFSASSEVIDRDVGRNIMDEIRRIVDDRSGKIQNYVNDRTQRNRWLTFSTVIALVLLFAFSVVAVLVYLKAFKDSLSRESILQQTNSDLKQSNTELESFAYVVSHDLQEPLRKLQTYSDLLGREIDRSNETLTHYASRIEASSQHMSTLIQDVLSLSRVNSQNIHLKRIDLNASLASVLESISVLVEEHTAKIEYKRLPSIDADPGQIELLLQNLIVNAIKFRSPKRRPTISITCYATKNRYAQPIWRLSVSDNGRGFEQKYAKRIFDMFERLNKDSSGTGIGLSICQKIVKRHDGTIRARSTPGKGSTFIIDLPRAPK